MQDFYLSICLFWTVCKGAGPEKDGNFPFWSWHSLPVFDIGTLCDYFSRLSSVMSTEQKTLCSFQVISTTTHIRKSLHRALEGL